MGKLHWQQHAAKPDPIAEYPIGDNEKMIVRRRQAGRASEAFVATVRYVVPPRKGQLVITYAYGRTIKEAELRALNAYYKGTQAG